MSRLSLGDIDELARLQRKILNGSALIDRLLRHSKGRPTRSTTGMSVAWRCERRWSNCSITSRRPPDGLWRS